jgi:hypothetical protein
MVERRPDARSIELGFHREVMSLPLLREHVSDTYVFWNRQCRRRHERLLAAIDRASRGELSFGLQYSGMLLGMLVFQPQRAVMFGHAAPPDREKLEQRAQIVGALFLRG